MATGESTSIQHAVPFDQPQSVSELAQRLFPAYRLDGGTVQLAGCALEDHLFVRLRFSAGDSDREFYLDVRGKLLERPQIESLGLDHVRPLTHPPESWNRKRLAQILETAAQLAEENPELSNTVPDEVVCIWCRHVNGKLRFHFGDKTHEQAFSGWTRRLKAPPVICPATGTQTFHLSQTDDGRIAAAEQIAACEESGRRVLAEELITCELTGRRVLPEHIGTCPVTGRRILAYHLLPCAWCAEEVDPECLQQQVCLACRKPLPVSKDDPRMVRILAEYPGLEHWGGWRLAETSAAYVMFGRRWLRRVLVVLDRDTLALKRAAGGGRLTSKWVPLEGPLLDEVLGTWTET